jgi:dTDP-4-dehydrorhamnose reductase
MAGIIRRVLLDHPELHGMLQVSSQAINKHDLLVLLKRAYGIDVEITPSDRVCIDRSLDSTRFRTLTGFEPPSWPSMIDDMAADPTPYESWRAGSGAQVRTHGAH